MSLNGKTAIVTAASSGIGRGIARELAKDGVNLVLHYNSAGDVMEQLVKDIGALGVKHWEIQADFNNMDDVKKLAEEAIASAGTIDFLVNNAGVCIFTDFLDITDEEFDFTFNVNIKSMFFLVQMISKHMIEKGVKGRIVNIGSVSGILGSPTQVHYCAAKAAVQTFTKSAAIALAPYDLTVNAVLPGPIVTKHNCAFLEGEGKEAVLERTTLHRYGQPENIAQGVKYFLSDLADWTTGSQLIIDGGMIAK